MAIPAVTGAIGVAGGVLLGQKALHRDRKILGITVPGRVSAPKVKIDLAGISSQIGEVGKQFGRLANEVKVTRQKAEQIGKAAEQVGKAIGG